VLEALKIARYLAVDERDPDMASTENPLFSQASISAAAAA
jgi:hypothetical protein